MDRRAGGGGRAGMGVDRRAGGYGRAGTGVCVGTGVRACVRQSCMQPSLSRPVHGQLSADAPCIFILCR